ncbi:rhamnan synthesis F family protein [Oerskovia enterophila]|uniref:Rhamnan synthesis protein F n=1 Tax=Oerskovia enterophila TaxID=43678 RepID=A0ABX2Y8G4_9CELL|nr:rhamnan synthesis F family protein [Oerskovia enterophila]OCI32558.1 rhamnan synthesis protein F [Oerskovia enterophila]
MKRVAIYLFWAADGHVDDYIPFCLEDLGRSVETIIFVSNGPLDEDSRARVAPFVAEIVERENVGLDVGGYLEGLARLGADRLREYDELVLLNYTFFGPVYPFAEVFERSETWNVDFWGLTDHGEVTPHPFAAKRTMHGHIQSHWIAVRRSLFDTDAFRAYWDTMPPIATYNDSVDNHEARFTHHFEELGYGSMVAFPERNYPTSHPAIDTPVLLLNDRCPIVKRRLFFQDPLYMNDNAVIGRDMIEKLRTTDYPVRLVWQNISHSAEPRVASTNMTLTHVLPDVPVGGGSGSEVSMAVLVHVFYESMIDELMDSIDHVPVPYDLYITTTDTLKKEFIERRLLARGREQFDVRVLESNRGRDITAFLIGLRDVLLDPKYDVMLKLHSKKSAQDGFTIGEWFKRHLMENLLSSPGYVQNVLDLFGDDESVGMVFPPVVQIGYATLGKAWYANKKPAMALAKRLGIDVAFDATTPLSPYGSMFYFRPDALRPLLDAQFTWSDFPLEGQYADGSLAHVVERLFSYSALSQRYMVHTVINTTNAAINYNFLEYKLSALSSRLPGTITEQNEYLESITGLPNVLVAIKRSVALRHPRVASMLRPAYRGVRGVRRIPGNLARGIKGGPAATASQDEDLT